jgi:hypothetical protein
MFANGPIRAVEIGCTDFGSMSAFFAILGFAENVGSASSLREDNQAEFVRHGSVELKTDAGASLVLVSCTTTSPHHTGFDLGPRALDFYCHNIEAGLGCFSEQGDWVVSEIAEIALGPVRMRQVMIHGPEGVDVVLVESTHRRPSLLDTEPSRVFSELHSVVWCVPDRDTEAEWWVASGATKGMDLRLSDPSLSGYLGLGNPEAEVEMVMLSDAQISPSRLELLSFPGVHALPTPASQTLASQVSPSISTATGSGVRSLLFDAFAPLMRTVTPGGISVSTPGS